MLGTGEKQYSLEDFVNKFKEVKEEANKYEGKNLIDKVYKLRDNLLLGYGIENAYQEKGDKLNDAIRDNELLQFIYATILGLSDCGKYINFSYNPRRAKNNRLYEYSRALVLEVDTLNLVSQSFNKFYNVGEKGITPNTVDSLLHEEGKGYAVNKLDGSIIGMRKYNNDIVINSKSKLSKKDIIKKDANGNEIKYTNYIQEAEKHITPNIKKALEENVNYSFIFELVGVTQVVVKYDDSKTGLHLIGIREYLGGYNSRLLDQEELREFAKGYNIPIEDATDITSYEDIENILESDAYKGQEGVVVYVGDNIYKVKKPEYLNVHGLVLNRNVNTVADIRRLGNLIAPLVINEKVDDYIGLLQGRVPEKVYEVIDYLEDEFEQYKIRVLDNYKKYEDMEPREFYKLINTEDIFPKEYVGIVKTLKQGTYNVKGEHALIKLLVGKVEKSIKPDEE